MISADTLNLNELPNALSGVGSLDVSLIALCIADFVKLDEAGNTFVGDAGQSLKDGSGINITGSLESPNKHAIAPGAIVAYEMTASEDEADTNEWVLSIGEVDADFDNYVDDESKDWDNDAEAYTEGVYQVQIGIEDDQFIGFFPYSHSQTGEDDDDWADKLVVVEKDKYNFATIAIDDTNFIEGGDIETISDSDVVESGDYNAIIVVDSEGEITRVFSLYNRI